MELTSKARKLIYNLTEGRNVRRNDYVYYLTELSVAENDLIDWFVEEDGWGNVHITEEAHVGLIDRIKGTPNLPTLDDMLGDEWVADRMYVIAVRGKR